MPSTNDLQTLLGQFGIDRKSLLKLRFGGVVGKQALVAIGSVAATAVVSIRAESQALQWGCLGGIVLVSVLVLGLNARHASKHPLEAILEGAEMVLMQLLKQEVATKGVKSVPESPPRLEGIGKKREQL